MHKQKYTQAKSLDGTRVPYFMVSREAIDLNSAQPTLLYGYGGFEISMLPFYASKFGAGWLERGGVFVLANIRGGGEFGPSWHQAALKEKRHKVGRFECAFVHLWICAFVHLCCCFGTICAHLNLGFAYLSLEFCELRASFSHSFSGSLYMV